MRAPAPLALGCISLVLCLLQLPGCRPLPAGRSPKHREPPDRRPSPALLQAPRQRPALIPLHGDPPGLQPPAPPQLAGGSRRRQLAPRHGPRLTPRHGPRPAPRHGHRRGAPLAPRHPVAHRGRRHAGGRLHHAQLLRVGCVLGTCQVQNLSHRLWQLMGQSGRQDSSPMNPNSPHSYG
ncbi:protein ADM2 [Aythya fuligula]|uniref:Protein ADM2 n=1 Tax=Aythya fuligula TaxID=219594 RepID=A0A6J3DT49_AYTFU|nr:protein ADM2 [Aythya fuligula]